MPKAQVLVTITAEALVDVPADTQDVEAYCRENVGLAWGALELASVVQPAAVKLDYFIVPEPEPVVAAEAVVEDEMPAAEAVGAAETSVEAAVEADEPVAEALSDAAVAEVLSRFDDPAFEGLVRMAIRARAAQLLEEVVQQVVSELEPLLERHLARNSDGPA